MSRSNMNPPRTREVEARAGRPLEHSLRAILGRDHDRLERLFQTIIAAADSTDPAELRDAWLAFEGELERHLDLEEKQILPQFAAHKPDEARRLIEEHGQIRARLMDMGVDLDLHCLGSERIRALVETLRAHARREDALLYPWASQHLGPALNARVSEALESKGKARSAARDEWWIDTSRSRLGFSLRHIVVHQIRGQFTRWGGTIKIDAQDIRKSTVRVWVDLASVETGEPERDEQVRSSEFFDIKHFPRARFLSTQLRLSDSKHPVITGALELHGVKCDVEVEITDDDPWRSDPEAERMSFAIKGRFDRRQFGLRWNQDLDVGGVVVGDEIEVTARIELVRAKPARITKPG